MFLVLLKDLRLPKYKKPLDYIPIQSEGTEKKVELVKKTKGG